jgi:CRP-like cAMP-binding protein
MGQPTFTSFDAVAFLAVIGHNWRSVRYGKKEVIFSQGDPSDSIFYIEKGHVKLSVVSAEGKEAILAVSNGGTFFGESCIESDHPIRIHSVVALTEVDLVRIDRAAILWLLRTGGQEALDFTAFLLRRNAEIQKEFANSLLEPSEERLARILFSMRRFDNRRNSESGPKLSQQTIAEMMGVSRQHVNGLIKRCKKVQSPTVPRGASA